MVPGGRNQPASEQITLLLDSGELRNLDVTAVASVRFTDPALQAQFKDYLAALVGARSKEKRSVYIDSTGAKARQISARYMIPTPVWKSSYRLIFGAAGEPMLEGWAIVDNTTGEDWTNVQLSLVSGRPISFISRAVRAALHQPAHGGAARGPRASAGDLSGAIEELKKAQWELAAPDGRGWREWPNRGMAAPVARRTNWPSPSGAAMMPSSIAATAAAQELGELFEYRFGSAVTIRKNESAMLPFLQQKIAARKLLVYSDQSSDHPMNAAEITNSTGKTLDGGPITVYDGGAYAGEALVETLKTGDKRLISYAVDLGTRITTAIRFQGRPGARNSLAPRRPHRAHRRRRDQDLHHPQRGSESEDADHRASARSQYKVTDQKPIETTPQRLSLRSEAGRERHGKTAGDRGARLRQHHRGDQPDSGCSGELRSEQEPERRGAQAAPADPRPQAADRRRRRESAAHETTRYNSVFPGPGADAPEHQQPEPA